MEESPGWVLPLSDSFRVAVAPEITRPARVSMRVAGQTIADIADQDLDEEQRRRAVATIDGVIIPRTMWRYTKPRAGHFLAIRVMPQAEVIAGVAAVLATVVSAAVPFAGAIGPAVFTAAFGTFSAATAFLLADLAVIGTGALAIGGSALLVGALSAPSLPRLSSSRGTGAISPTLSGTTNRFFAYGPVWRPYGVIRLTPPLAAQPYTEVIGGTMYLRMLLTPGHGPLELSDFRIGDTPIGNYEGVQIQTRQGFPGEPGLTLYPRDVSQQSVGATFPTAAFNEPTISPSQIRTTARDVIRCTLDFSMPQGLMRFNENGKRREFSFRFQVHFRKVGGTGGWIFAQQPPNFFMTNIAAPNVSSDGSLLRGMTDEPFLFGIGFNFPEPGQYEIRVRRFETEPQNARPGGADASFVLADMVWTTLRSETAEEPVNLDGLAMIAVRIKATDQLQGVIQNFNCLAKSVLPVWDGNQWDTANPVATSNPAAIYRDVLQGRANARALPDSRVDLDGLGEFYEFCEAQNPPLEFNGVFDSDTTVGDVLRDVTSVARATPNIRDGLHSVVVDSVRPLPVQLFTPLNMHSFTERKPFASRPHAVKVRFLNAEVGYEQDERVVFDDGYDETNATLYQEIDAVGITDSVLAFRYGRYFLRVGSLRPEVYSFETDFEHLVCERGSRIRVAHYGPLWGQKWDRVRAQVLDGADLTGLDFAESFTFEDGKSYGLVVRLSDGSHLRLAVVNPVAPGGMPQEVTSVTLEAPITSGNPMPQVGDLVAFGERMIETVDLIVTRIQPLPDLGARIEAIDYSPDVFALEQEEVPPFQSQISNPVPFVRRAPPPPTIVDVISDEGALIYDAGVFVPRILVLIQPVETATVPTARFQAQFRPVASDGNAISDWVLLPDLPPSARQVVVQPVLEGAIYDVRLRSVSALGATSEWVTIFSHTVIGRTSLPPDVLDLRLERGDLLVWTIPFAPLDLHGFMVRIQNGENTNWESAQPLHDGVVSDSQFPLRNLGGGTRTFLVKAIDTSEHESLNAAVLIKDLGDVIVSNVVETIDEHPTFDGEKTNATVVSNELRADEEPNAFWGGDAELFWGADSDLFWDSVYRQMVYKWDYTPTPTLVNVNGVVRVEFVAQGPSIQLEYALDVPFWGDDPDLFWGADAETFWSEEELDFVPFPGAIQGLDRAYQFRMTIGSGIPRGIVQELSVVLDADDVAELLEDIVISSGGSRLSLTKTYNAIKTVALTLQQSGSHPNAHTARIVDKDASLGPLIEVLDAAGNTTSGVLDATVQGY